MTTSEKASFIHPKGLALSKIKSIFCLLALTFLFGCNSATSDRQSNNKDSLIKTQNEAIAQLQTKLNELNTLKNQPQKQPYNNEYFSIGSSENDVLSIQGEPKSVFNIGDLKTFTYGFSSITFKNGIVDSYINDGNLKIKIKAGNEDLFNKNGIGEDLKIDSKFGFRDLKLETDFETLNNKYSLTKTNSDDLIETYELKGISMYIEDIFIEYINLTFINQKLYAISFKIDCDKKTGKLTNLIEDGYGKMKENPESHDFYIKGKKAELLYQPRGKQLQNGYIEAFAYLSITSIELKKRITGTNNTF